MARKTKYESGVDQNYKIDKGRKRPKYRQGIYNPRNPQKCINIQKKKKIEFRSNLEFEYFYQVDNSYKIKQWGSEVLWIPYFNPVKKRVSQYWVDLIVWTEAYGIIAIEIKPAKEIIAIHENKKPKMTKRKKKETFIYEMQMFEINKAKWIAAKEYCNKRGWKFIQLSEKDIKSGKIPFL